MSDWERLVSAAVLGTARREPPALEDGPARGLVPDDGPEARLLTAAGVIGLYRRAGRRPMPAPALPPPAAPDAAPICSPAAAIRLRQVLAERRTLLPEWLGAVAAAGLRPPPELLPDLLDAPLATPALREPVERVLGERGRWLSEREPRWAWAAPIPADEAAQAEVWRTGERPQRRRLFSALRATDPARARALLEGSWREEDGRERAAFVEAMATGLGPEDEPLLEAALDDRRQEVRQAAAATLAGLPGSAFGARMAERALALTGRDPFAIALPEGVDAGMRRDGVVERRPGGWGRRAWWLVQVVAGTPLATWERAGLTPAGAAALSGEAADPLRAGLAQAALTQRDEAWAEALADLRPEVAPALRPETLAARAAARLAEGDPSEALAIEPPWPASLTPAALPVLARLVAQNERAPARAIAERLHPAAAGAAEARLAEVRTTPAASRLAGDVLTILTLRRDMHEEIDERRPA